MPSLLPADDDATHAAETDKSPTQASDRRIPIALALLGASFVAIGLGLLWVASSAMYTATETEIEQFTRAITAFVPGPAISTGLITIGAAIAMAAARS